MADSAFDHVVTALERVLKNGGSLSYQLSKEVQLSKCPELWPVLTKLVEAGRLVVACVSDSPDGESYDRKLEQTDVWANVNVFINEIIVHRD